MCIYICLLLSAFCLSHVDNQIPQTPTHILPPCKITARAEIKPYHRLAPPLACTPSPQLKWEFEKPDVNLSSIPSEPPPPSPPGIFFLIPAAFSISCFQKHTEVERQAGDARFLLSEVPSSLTPFSLPRLQGAFFPSICI